MKLGWLDIARFWSKADIPKEIKLGISKKCWIWKDKSNAHGYGVFRVHGKQIPAARVAVILAGLKLKPKEVPDHLCRVRNCVNPFHLEVVTPKINALRGIGPTAQNAKKTHCPRGHAFATDGFVNSKGSRECRTCLRFRRGWKGNSDAALRTHCPRGHKYTPSNTYLYRGSRGCRTCIRLRHFWKEGREPRSRSEAALEAWKYRPRKGV